MIASSMIQLGLSWWQAWICVWIGNSIVGLFVALNARQGAIFHIPFPVVARTSFGLFGSLWCTLNRMVRLSCPASDLLMFCLLPMISIWYGVKTSIGGN